MFKVGQKVWFLFNGRFDKFVAMGPYVGCGIISYIENGIATVFNDDISAILSTSLLYDNEEKAKCANVLKILNEWEAQIPHVSRQIKYMNDEQKAIARKRYESIRDILEKEFLK